MKTKIQFKRIFVFAVFIVLFSFKGYTQDKIYENRYLFLYVPAVYHDHIAFFSDPIFYSNYSECGADYTLKDKAEKAYSNYLSTNYPYYFPNGTQNIRVCEYVEFSTSQYLKTKEEAYDRMNALKEEILSNDHGYSGLKDEVYFTNFTYSCE